MKRDSSRRHLKFAKETDFSVAVANLEGLVDCLRKGTLHVGHHRTSLRLHPDAPCLLDLQAKVKGNALTEEGQVNLTLQWQTRRPD